MSVVPGSSSASEAAVEPAAVLTGPRPSGSSSRRAATPRSASPVCSSPLVMLAHLVWLVTVFNTDSPVMAGVFAAGIAIVDIYAVLSIINSWNVDRPGLRKLPHGEEQMLAVLIPTCGEPVEMVLATLRSVIDQQWPRKKLVIVLGDDRNDPKVRRAVSRLRSEHRSLNLHYHVPPTKRSARRQGEAKAGNLNSCLAYALTVVPVDRARRDARRRRPGRLAGLPALRGRAPAGAPGRVVRADDQARLRARGRPVLEQRAGVLRARHADAPGRQRDLPLRLAASSGGSTA